MTHVTLTFTKSVPAVANLNFSEELFSLFVQTFENFPMTAELQNEQKNLLHVDLYFEINVKMQRDSHDSKM